MEVLGMEKYFKNLMTTANNCGAWVLQPNTQVNTTTSAIKEEKSLKEEVYPLVKYLAMYSFWQTAQEMSKLMEEEE